MERLSKRFNMGILNKPKGTEYRKQVGTSQRGREERKKSRRDSERKRIYASAP